MPKKKKIQAKPGPGRPKDLEKRAYILKTAGYLFMEKGFTGTTMDDIAAYAGVSKLTVYNNFGTKEALFHDVIKTKCESYAGDGLFASLPAQNPRKELFTIGRAFMDLIFSDDAIAMHRVIIADGHANPELAMMFYKAAPAKLFERFTRYLEKLEQKHTLHFPDKMKAGKFFFAMFKGEPHMRAILKIPPSPTKKELDAFARDCVDFFLRAHYKV
jgi:TetR/AcrR family transcriptional regulator, mexJK operon transcriptional repressor